MNSRACSLCSSPNPPEALFCLACGTPLDAPLSAPREAGADRGELIADGFGPLPARTCVREGTLELVQVLGQGGFGITYLAHEKSTGRLVAVKELFPFGCVRRGGQVVPSTLLDPDAWQAAREGFRREGALLSNHSHPHVVQVLDVWEEHGTTLLAMEYLDGQTLAQILERKGALSTRRTRAMLEQIGGALSLLHGAGMMHRDIKPENIMLCCPPESTASTWAHNMGVTTHNSEPERWVLLDFGAARAFAAGRSVALTQIVTPGYAPLEQYASRARGGPPSDIYALGATAYHALTGSVPPPATERASSDELRPADEVNPHIPRSLSRAITRALSLRVDQRPQGVEAWLREMDEPPSSSAATSATTPVAAVAPSSTLPSQWPNPIPAPPDLPATEHPSPPRAHARSMGAAHPQAPWEASSINQGEIRDAFGGAMEVFEGGSTASASTFASTSAGLSSAATTEREWNGASERETKAQGVKVAPQSFELSGNSSSWYRVTVEARRIEWPKRCACCGEGMTVALDVRTPAIWWQIPYCAGCREHAERGESILVISNILTIGAFALGSLYLLMEAFEPGLWLWCIALAVKVASRALTLGLMAAHRAATGSPCCDYRPAARFKERAGNRYVWEFRSREFAEEFCSLNGGDVKLQAAPDAAPLAHDTPSHTKPGTRPRVPT